MLDYRKCAYCGEIFYPTGARQRFCTSKCNKKCKAEKYNAKIRSGEETFKPSFKGCACCGKVFWASCVQMRYCSDDCRQESVRKRNKEYMSKYSKQLREENAEFLKQQIREEKKKEKTDSVTSIAVKARQAGMTYGQYQAMLYAQEHRLERRGN